MNQRFKNQFQNLKKSIMILSISRIKQIQDNIKLGTRLNLRIYQVRLKQIQGDIKLETLLNLNISVRPRNFH